VTGDGAVGFTHVNLYEIPVRDKALGAEAGTSVAVRSASDPNKYVWDIVMMG